MFVSRRATFLALLGLIVVVAVATPQLTQAALLVVHNDRVHYVTHLVAGQLLSLSPWTQHLGQVQIDKGMYHAHTPHQVALLTDHPSQLVRGAVRRIVA